MFSNITGFFSNLYNGKPNVQENNLLNNKNKEINEINHIIVHEKIEPPSYSETFNKSLDNLMLNNIQTFENNNINMDKYIKELEDNGYTVVPNVYNQKEIEEYWKEFNKWKNSIQNLDYYHSIIDYHGIFKYFQVSHQRFAWLARTNPKILNIFKKIWETNELVCSFDGCCYYPTEIDEEPSYWIHTDQSPQKKGVWCYQSFLSLTNNSERTFVLFKGTHKYHEDYFNTMNINNTSDWNIIEESYLDTYHKDKLEILDVSAGDLVIWDSRLFHQNTCGTPTCNEERLVQYLCYLPKNSLGNNTLQQNLRNQYFNELRTTNHWPYPMAPISDQPRTYNYYHPDNEIIINYNEIPKPQLDDLLPEIKKLL